MFNLLSNQSHLVEHLNALNEQELTQAKDNLQQLVSLLSVPAAKLLMNRKATGNMLAQNYELADNVSSTSEILLSKDALINQINQLCLTEAVVVRDTFENCLEVITSQVTITSQTATASHQAIPAQEANVSQEATAPISNKKPLTEKTTAEVTVIKPVSKNNVSPIRLGEIKQRLAQAVETDNHQKQAVKAKLNGLLKPKSDSISTPLPKQA